jgi:hypothetical protein
VRKIRVTIKDAMAFWNDDAFAFIPNLTYTPVNTAVFEVPDTWIDGDHLADGMLARMYAHIYGETWESGNEDGSKYEVLECKVEVLPPGDPAEAKPI